MAEENGGMSPSDVVAMMNSNGGFGGNGMWNNPLN